MRLSCSLRLCALFLWRIWGIVEGMKKPKKQTTLREDTGKILIDLGKVVFGSIFLGVGLWKFYYWVH
jgi:hypothetical protein